jgi:hypothetical protein
VKKLYNHLILKGKNHIFNEEISSITKNCSQENFLEYNTQHNMCFLLKKTKRIALQIPQFCSKVHQFTARIIIHILGHYIQLTILFISLTANDGAPAQQADKAAPSEVAEEDTDTQRVAAVDKNYIHNYILRSTDTKQTEATAAPPQTVPHKPVDNNTASQFPVYDIAPEHNHPV